MPKAADKLRDPNGIFVMPTMRVPATIHREAKREAARQGRSLNAYFVAVLAKNLGQIKRRRQTAAAE